MERERELAYRQSLIDSLYECSPNGILVITDEREVLTYNDRFADLWGVPDSLLEADGGPLPLATLAGRVDDAETLVRK